MGGPSLCLFPSTRPSCPLPPMWSLGAVNVMGSCKRSSRGKGSCVTRSNLASRGLSGASASRKACPSCQAGVGDRRAAKAGPRRAIGNRLCCGTLLSDCSHLTLSSPGGAGRHPVARGHEEKKVRWERRSTGNTIKRGKTRPSADAKAACGASRQNIQKMRVEFHIGTRNVFCKNGRWEWCKSMRGIRLLEASEGPVPTRSSKVM